MSSDIPQTDLWLERSRLDGMLLGAVSYGAFSVEHKTGVYLCTGTGGFFILTIQAAIALMRRPRNGETTANNRLGLISYIFITFVLGTIGFAGNAKFTEMIWIDLRNARGGPVALIQDELNYTVNILVVVW